MRFVLPLGFIMIASLASGTALAGSLTVDNGNTDWHPTGCTAPKAPPSILKANSETRGEDMNVLAAQYNRYVRQAQDYMNCVSKESEEDSTNTSQAINAAAQKIINDTSADVKRLGAPFGN
jgi:hypothetical protein